MKYERKIQNPRLLFLDEAAFRESLKAELPGEILNGLIASQVKHLAEGQPRRNLSSPPSVTRKSKQRQIVDRKQ